MTSKVSGLNAATDKSVRTDHIPFLDGIRGFAALWVLLAHTSAFCGLPINWHKSSAVDVFMIMSGFLMTEHYLVRRNREPWESPATWLSFYVRRFFRIAPLYYLVLVPSFLWFTPLMRIDQALNAVHRNAHSVFDQTARVPDLTNVLAHVSFLFGLLPKYCSSLSIPDWSISLEMQFYFCFPFIMLLARRMNLLLFAGMLGTLWLVARQCIGVYAINPPRLLGHLVQPSFLPLKLGVFLIGILLAWAWMEDVRLTRKSAPMVVIALVLSAMANVIIVATTLLIAFLLFYPESVARPRIGHLKVLMTKVLANPFSRFIGHLSYGVYLLHMLILIAVMRVLSSLDWYIHSATGNRFVVTLSSVALLTYAIAWILYNAVEVPGIKAGRTLSKLIRSFQTGVSAEYRTNPQPLKVAPPETTY